MTSDLIVKVKYFGSDLEELEFIGGAKSNWIDLRSATTLELHTGDFVLIPLGVAMELPHGYEAHIAPRSSTFKNYGLLQTNGIGIIDNSYSGDNDQWYFPAYATRDTLICLNDRICQFRLVPTQERVVLTTVPHLGNPDRGGHGSTGIK